MSPQTKRNANDRDDDVGQNSCDDTKKRSSTFDILGQDWTE